jgi:hypothetical protein
MDDGSRCFGVKSENCDKKCGHLQFSMPKAKNWKQAFLDSHTAGIDMRERTQ